MTEREVRYCTSADGTFIAYSKSGEGPPILNPPGSWESFTDRPEESSGVYDRVLQGWTRIDCDLRGCGLSQRDASSYALDRLVEDLEAVADAAQIDRFTLLGTTMSSAPAIRYAIKHPERVARLVLLTIISESNDVMSLDAMKSIASLVRTNWEVGSQTLADMGNRASNAAVAFQLAEIYRRTTNGETVASMLEDLYDTVHLRDELTKLPMPTLIIHRKAMTPWPFSAAAHAASAIPNATLVPLEGDGPISLGEDAETNIRIVASFLDEDPETRGLPSAGARSATTKESAFRTVLFTDLVGHTEMMSRLGDEKGRDVLREHERITREVLKANGGTEVKTMGDGFMASFGSVTKAVECAVALQVAVDEHNRGVGARRPPGQNEDAGSNSGAKPESPSAKVDVSPLRASVEPLSVRVGLNAGEPIEEDGDLFGATVILASRIAAKAGGGEILVADTVRGLCSGKGFLFADRGEFVAKGFEEPVRISEVNWRHA